MFENLVQIAFAHWVIAFMWIIAAVMADSRYRWFKKMVGWTDGQKEIYLFVVVYFLFGGLAIFIALTLEKLFGT